MAKIVFYEDNTAALVEGFMKKVHDPAVPDVPSKASFIDSTDIETRTKISTEDNMRDVINKNIRVNIGTAMIKKGFKEVEAVSE